jgi:PAS domain S-box-containing protein
MDSTSTLLQAKLMRVMLLLVVVVILLSPSLGLGQQSTSAKRVLVLYWHDRSYPFNAGFEESFRKALPTGVFEYYPEYLETNRFPGETQSLALRDYLRQKYVDRAPDVIVTVGYTTLDFVSKYRNDLFPNTPIVFILPSRPSQDLLVQRPDMTGLVTLHAFTQTLDLALRLHPDTQHVFVVSGNLERDKRFETTARQELKAYESRLDVSYLTDLTPEELTVRAKTLPPRSIILFVSHHSQNAQGKTLESFDHVALLSQSARVPIYAMSGPALGYGLVGGYLYSMESTGAKVAEIVNQIANGARARDIPIQNAPAVPMFDWRELYRWNISEDRLPPGSIVRFKQLTVWEQHRGRIIGVLGIILLETLLIAALLVERKRQRRVAHSLAASEDRFARVFRANPQPILVTTLEDCRYIEVNDSFLDMSGYQRHEVLHHSSIELNMWPSPHEHTAFVEKLKQEGSLRNTETLFRRKDGAVRVLLSSAELVDISGKPCILIVSSDITDRKESERQLAELTGRLLRTQDEERRRIARELHDVTAQSIGLIMLNLAQVQNAASALDKPSKDKVTESLALGEQALKDIRTLSYVLHPPLLDQAGLMTALKWYVKGFQERSGVKVAFTESGYDGHRMPPEVEYALFRVVQECLTNIRRHTNSETAEISLTRTTEEVSLSVRDYGKGYQVEMPRNGDSAEFVGVGIPGMRHRLKQLGGELLVDSNQEGTTVTATVPVRWVIHDSDSVS